MTNFSAIYQTSHGDTIESDNPRLDAFKQSAYLNACGHIPQITQNADMSYTVKVQSGKIAPLTFEPSKTPQPEEVKESKRNEIKSQRMIKEQAKRNSSW